MPSRPRRKKVEISLANWVLGGSLISVTRDPEPTPRHKSASRVVVTEIDSVSIPSVKSLSLLIDIVSKDSADKRRIITRLISMLFT